MLALSQKIFLTMQKRKKLIVFCFSKYLWPFKFFLNNLNCPSLNSRAPDRSDVNETCFIHFKLSNNFIK